MQVRLLGGLEIELDGVKVASAISQRPWALFAYLALSPRPLSRAHVAARFWPDVLDSSARASLRSALWKVRRDIGEWLVVDGERIALREGLWVDVREFDRFSGAGEIDKALELCRGELLEGLDDDWALAARQRHRERVVELLEQAAVESEGRDELRAAVDYTRRQAACDPFDEDAHRRLISRLDAAGDRAGALRVYRALADRLRGELGVAPSSLTRELVERLRAETPVASQPGAAAAPPGALPLVGRQHELGELEDAWRAAAAGSGAAVVIRGDAGIGKTRLATELSQRAASAGALVAVSAALDLGGAAPFSLWAELIRQLLPSLPAPPFDAAWPDDLTLLAGALPPHFARTAPPSAGIPPDLQRTRLFEAVVALLEWATRERPLFVVLDDIHTADRPSLELAAYAARRAAELPLLLVLTRRELPHSADADRLEHVLRARGLLGAELTLGPLPDSSLARLARSVAKLSDAGVEQVVAKSDGNALLAVETARALARGEDDVAPSLRGSVRAALEPLSGEARLLVELAAVATRPLEPVELELAPVDRPGERAAQALETGVLVASEGRLGFRHALLREAVYFGIAEPRRPGLHERWAGLVLAAEDHGGVPRPAEAARHLMHARRPAEAVEQLARAAKDAKSVAALEQAAAFLEEAIAVVPGRVDLILELAEVESWRGRREPAEAAFARVLALLADGDPIAEAHAWICRARAYHGPLCVPRLVLDSSRRAIEKLDEAGQGSMAPARREAVAAWAWSEAVAGDVDEAERLVDVLSAEPLDDDSDQFHLSHARALLLMRRGRFADSYEHAVTAGEAAAAIQRPDLAYGCWANAAGAAAAAGDAERALEFLDDGMDVLSGQGLQSVEIQLWGSRSFILASLGRLDEAQAATNVERELADRLGELSLICMACHDQGLVALAQGDYPLAAELLEQALADSARISRPLTRLALAEALAHAGEADRAAVQLRETVLEPVGPSDFPDALVPRLARVQGLVALAREDRDEAIRRLEESVAGWGRQVARASMAESMAAVLADLGRPVVGLIEPERELERARGELGALLESVGRSNAVVQ